VDGVVSADSVPAGPTPKLQGVVARVLGVAPASVVLDSGPHSIPSWDSAGHVNLILALEQEFGVTFDEDEVVELVSVEAIASALARRDVRD
jgi:acyl carrier protein